MGFFKEYGGALLGGAMSGVGALFGNRQRKKMSDYALEQSKKMFDYQNAYNTPKAQMDRLRKAGLNPALMYQQGTTGNAVGAPQMKAPEVESIGANVAQSAAAGAQASLTDAHRAVLRADAINKLADADNSDANTRRTNQLVQLELDNLEAQLDKTKRETLLLEQTFEQQKNTGMLKGDILGNLAKVYGININTPEGKEAAKDKITLLISMKAIGDLAPSFINAISSIVKARMGGQAGNIIANLQSGDLSDAEKTEIIKNIFKNKKKIN